MTEKLQNHMIKTVTFSHDSRFENFPTKFETLNNVSINPFSRKLGILQLRLIKEKKRKYKLHGLEMTNDDCGKMCSYSLK
jgi:hypothetical protein